MTEPDNGQMSLEGKIALVTGGTSGIGKATACLLVREGAKVFTFGRHKEKLKKALSEIRDYTGREITGFVADSSDKESVKRVFEKIDKAGDLDILINNAALPARSIMDSTFDFLEYLIDVNITGYLTCSKFALERMLPRKNGHIINIGSMSAHVKEGGADLYVASKSAIAGFTDSLRKEMIPSDIRVSLIESGSVATGMITENEEQKALAIKAEKLLKPMDIAEAILFILTRPKGCEIIDLQLKAKKQRF